MLPIKTVVLSFLVLLLFASGLCQNQRSKRSSSHHDIEFSTPDLSVVFEGEHGEEPLTAYKVANKSEWVSIGSPFIMQSANGTPSYVLTPEAINVNVRLLSEAQREALIHAAREKYRNITQPKINLIPLQRFTCDLVIFDDGQRHLLQGHVHQLQRYSTVIEMSYPEGSPKRRAFENRIKRDDPIVWKCMLLANGRVHRSNTLKLDVARIQSALSLGSIFGNGDQAYVTRKQLNEITQKVRSVVSMEEIIDIGEEGFTEQFKNQVLNLAATEFAQVDIDEALSKLAKFGTNFDSRDLSPTEIKQELSKVLLISNDSSKQHIYASNDTRRSGSNRQDLSVDVGLKGSASVLFGLFSGSVDASVNVAKTNENRWKNSDATVDDQLREINTASHKDVTWERRGSVIVPKSINVARLNRAALETEKSFLATKTIIRDASYAHPIELYSHKLELSSSQEQLHRMNERIAHTATQLEHLVFALDAQIANLSSSISTVESAASSARWSISQKANELDTQLQQLRSQLYARGPYVKAIGDTTSCQTVYNHDHTKYGSSAAVGGHISMKSVTCVHLGNNYFVSEIHWLDVSPGHQGYSNTLHAQFECCKIVLQPTVQEVIAGSSAYAVAG